jgi:hypothetical protein
VVRLGVTHIFQQFIHTLSFINIGFEQGFLPLSTVIVAGYYYYLYIKKTRSLANHTALNLFLHSNNFGLSNLPTIMKDFQLKKMRATT